METTNDQSSVRYRRRTQDLLPRGGAEERSGNTPLAWIPYVVPHVSQPDTGAGRQLPSRGAGPARFGFSDAPDRRTFSYTFEHLAAVIRHFTETIGLERYAIYVFDYGAPVGLRLALANPERVTAIISQNGNAYEEGLSQGWNPIQKYWKEPTPENRAALRDFLTPESTRFQYVHGVPDESLVAPESWALDSALLARPGNDEIQLDLFLDYASNVALYPKFQEYFRASRPPLLAVWGRHDPFFLPPGAEAFRRDNPNAKVHFYDTGHFALETHYVEIAAAIGDFLSATQDSRPAGGQADAQGLSGSAGNQNSA